MLSKRTLTSLKLSIYPRNKLDRSAKINESNNYSNHHSSLLNLRSCNGDLFSFKEVFELIEKET